MKRAQQVVERFNRKYPPGSRCILRTDSNEREVTVKFEASIVGGQPVGWFNELRGCYAIDRRVSPIPDPESQP